MKCSDYLNKCEDCGKIINNNSVTAKELFDTVYQWGRVGIVTDENCNTFKYYIKQIEDVAIYNYRNTNKTTSSILTIIQNRQPIHYKRLTVDWNHVAKCLTPEQIKSLELMESTGGEPDIIEETDDYYLFADYSEDSPIGRRNLNYDELEKKADEMGVEMMNKATYRKLQKMGKFDENSWIWLKTPQNIRDTGYALFGDRVGDKVRVGQSDARDLNGYGAWRGSLRVSKV